jgi:general secretion pathway protein E
MGIEPFLLASSMNGVLAQRLVRVLDPECREAYTLSPEECARLGLNIDTATTLYRPRSDLEAGSSGYRGRTGIYELVPVTETMRSLIHDGAAEARLEALARELSPSILEDGWRKAVEGVTSLEEVLRVTRER